MQIEFSGGLETAFGGERSLTIDTGVDIVPLQQIIDRLAGIVKARNGDLTVFLQDGLVRPGILVLINDMDWELLEKEDTLVGPNDVVHFNSTLHGG